MQISLSIVVLVVLLLLVVVLCAFLGIRLYSVTKSTKEQKESKTENQEPPKPAESPVEHLEVVQQPPKTEEIAPKTLGETLKDHRVKSKMTQQFIAQTLGVSRQAVSKWERDAAEPTAANLVALAQLFETTPEELHRTVQTVPVLQTTQAE